MEKRNKRELQAEQTYQKLLATSVDMIVKKGYDNVSISEICSRCDVAKGTFYTYFNSKKDIVIKILADINKEIFNKDWDISLPIFDRIIEYIDCYMGSIQCQGADFTRVFLKIIMDEKLDVESVGAHKHRIHVAKIIDSGKEKGVVRGDLETNEICRYLQGYIYGIMIDWCGADGDYDIVKYGKKAVSGFLDMLRPG
mgnify:CR=1 FL=1